MLLTVLKDLELWQQACEDPFLDAYVNEMEFIDGDNYHNFLLENELIEVDDEPDEDGIIWCRPTSQRAWNGALDYFLDFKTARSDFGKLCVEATITSGGPEIWLEQWFGRGYTLKESWGGNHSSMKLDDSMTEWLDRLFTE